jgi:hypothetical protein
MSKYSSLRFIFKNRISLYVRWLAEAILHAPQPQMAEETLYYVSAMYSVSVAREQMYVGFSLKHYNVEIVFFCFFILNFLYISHILHAIFNNFQKVLQFCSGFIFSLKIQDS